MDQERKHSWRSWRRHTSMNTEEIQDLEGAGGPDSRGLEDTWAALQSAASLSELTANSAAWDLHPQLDYHGFCRASLNVL